MADTERVWLVERTYGNDEDLVTLVYATPDGTRHLRKQLSHRMLFDREITAARDVETDRLEATPEADRDRYAAEASRMAAEFDPDDGV